MVKFNPFKGKKEKGSKNGDNNSSNRTNNSNNDNNSTEEMARERPRRPRATRSMGGNSVASAGSSSSAEHNANNSDSATCNTTVFKVSVPDGVRPGQEFQVYAGTRIVRVKCPLNSTPGQTLSITVPRDPNAPMPGEKHAHHRGGGANGVPQHLQNDQHNQQQQQQQYEQNIDNLPCSPGVTRMKEPGNGPPAFQVEIPTGVRGGTQFPVVIQGQNLMVTCPPNARPGNKVRIVPPPLPQPPPLPPPPSSLQNQHSQYGQGQHNDSKQRPEEKTQLFEVTVPQNVNPGQAFALLAGGVRVQVTCPLNATAGSKIRFKLPLALTMKPKHQTEAAAQRLSYDKDGWTRTVRVSDMKLQWVRMDDVGNLDNSMMTNKFDTEKSAYVRRLEFREGSDSRIRDGILTLVPANEGIVDSRIRGDKGEDLVTYSEIAQAQGKGFQDKAKWFQEKCSSLSVTWNEGHMRMNVRREHLLEDSVDAVMSLSRKDLRKLWRFEFIGEAGIDAGGLAREWFQLVTHEMFDPDMGFWQPSEANQMCMQINPASKVIHHDYLVYYRFLGRVMGKALFDSQLVAGHMVPFIYKHMLGWPITFKDIKAYDEEYYESLVQVKKMAINGDDIEMILCLDFTTTVDVMGAKEDVDLIPGGADIPVTNDNYQEYLEACLKYRMLERVKPQLNELLLGFFDVIPEPLLTVFDFQELELLMCGLPVIDIFDWQTHTEYSGDYEHVGADYHVCRWFWDVVEEFDQEMKARLLQFVTGTSGVPSRGFGVLQGNDGNIRKFTIHGVPVHTCLYPRAHTCFNRIDLPTYESKDELREKLKLAVTMVATGFDIE